MREFYGISVEDKNYDLIENLKYTDELLKKKLFSMAENAFGDYFCIKLADGTIWFVYHDANRKVQIADCFNDFVKRCKSKKLDERMKMSVKEREESMIAKGRGQFVTDGLRKMWQDEIDIYESTVQEEVELDW